jgi:hypothetical protein
MCDPITTSHHCYPLLLTNCTRTLKQVPVMGCEYFSFFYTELKGTVQRKLTGVLSGINQQLKISQSVAWYFYLNLKGLGP